MRGGRRRGWGTARRGGRAAPAGFPARRGGRRHRQPPPALGRRGPAERRQAGRRPPAPRGRQRWRRAPHPPTPPQHRHRQRGCVPPAPARRTEPARPGPRLARGAPRPRRRLRSRPPQVAGAQRPGPAAAPGAAFFFFAFFFLAPLGLPRLGEGGRVWEGVGLARGWEMGAVKPLTQRAAPGAARCR